MSHWVHPVDPECPIVRDFHSSLLNDPMSEQCGCIDEILESFDKKHMNSGCERCAEYGCANVEIGD